MAAQEQVFGTVELLEAILLHLGMQDLLLVQTTSRTVRNTVQSSTRLRQKLWLEVGDGDHDATDAGQYYPGRPRINPLFAAPWVRQHCHTHIGRLEFGHPDLAGGVLAPVLSFTCRKGVSIYEEPRASWRDMLVVSRHEPYFQFRLLRHSPDNGLLELWQLAFFEKPPTAGELIDLALEKKSTSDLVIRADGSRSRANTTHRLRELLQELQPVPERRMSR